jgi:RimJ/RimL family protein N-acetyltransferase
VTLDTDRLILCPVAPADHARLHALFTQPGVRRVIFDDEIIPSDRTVDIIRTSEACFTKERFGLWLARLKPFTAEDVAPIGFGALWYFRDPPELELLYGVGDSHVKRGYGREIARAIVQYGFSTLHMPEIRASTDPAYTDSRRLLDDLGFTFERQAVVHGLDTVFYSRRRD